MRVLLGIVLGACLTVGTAFISDNWATSANERTATEHRSMVNWDVVGDNMRIMRQHAHSVWNRLSHKLAG